VVVVGDSILLGAASPIDARFRFAGFNPTVDAAESRSTSVGAGLVAEHLRFPTQALVVFLGANDSADTARFEGLVNGILDSAAGVKRVYWVTTPEVRDYYPAANQAVARVASRNRGAMPNMAVLDWAAVTGADPSLTSGDGLHLKPSGSEALASLVVQRVVDDHTADSIAALAAWEAAHTPSTTTTTITPTTTVAPSTTLSEPLTDELARSGTDEESQGDKQAMRTQQTSLDSAAEGASPGVVPILIAVGLLLSLVLWLGVARIRRARRRIET
jgi:hypothetical protein